MTRHSLYLLAMIAGMVGLLCPAPAWSQGEMSPSDGAKIVGTVPQVTFRWGGRPGGLYQVDVISVRGAVVASQSTKQTWVTVTLPATDIEYRWRLRELVSKEFHDVATRSFHFSTALTHTFDGRDGGEGANGTEGQNVTVTLTRQQDYIRVQVQGGASVSDFLLVPTSGPVTISARGGRGGTGLQGAMGNNGYRETHPTDGGPGGPGGNGGKGGMVRVIARGVDARKHVRVFVDGGTPGKGGPGGRPGNLPYMAQPGPDGPEGKKGEPGTVITE